LLYLFILHQQGCCRLILARFKKREREKKKEKCFLALFSPSALAAAAAAATAVQQLSGCRGWGVRHTREVQGPRCSTNGTGPQPWTDAVYNLMPSSSFSGKCSALCPEAAAAFSHNILKDKAIPVYL
jgi:hypothetical protein